MAQFEDPKALADRRILVVEDECFLAEDIAAVLEQFGAAIVGPVPTRERAAVLLEEGRVDLAALHVEHEPGDGADRVEVGRGRQHVDVLPHGGGVVVSRIADDEDHARGTQVDAER